MTCSGAGAHGPSVGCWLCDPQARDGPVGCLWRGAGTPGVLWPLSCPGGFGARGLQTPELGNSPLQTPGCSQGLWCWPQDQLQNTSLLRASPSPAAGMALCQTPHCSSEGRLSVCPSAQPVLDVGQGAMALSPPSLQQSGSRWLSMAGAARLCQAPRLSPSSFPPTPGKPQAGPAREEARRRKETFTRRRVSDEARLEGNTFLPCPTLGRPASSSRASTHGRARRTGRDATAAQINRHIWAHVGSLTRPLFARIPARPAASHPGCSRGANTKAVPLGAGGTGSRHGTGDRERKAPRVPAPQPGEGQHLQQEGPTETGSCLPTGGVRRWLPGSGYLLFLKKTN